MKSIAHHDGGRGAHPLGIVEHVAAVVAVRHKCMIEGVEQAFFERCHGRAGNNGDPPRRWSGMRSH